ncbi:MAG: hypothetical protein K9J74_03515 [Sulfuritalea sp.]|nr:hypothetical protein [Sulfuritalea sp.]
MKSPIVFGELIAGVVPGPSLFGWILTDNATELLAEMGIILLFLKSTWKQMSNVWRRPKESRCLSP